VAKLDLQKASREELIQKIKDLRLTIRYMQIQTETRNKEVDALHYVWCNGNCLSGVHRLVEEAPTPELLSELADYGQRNVDRLRTKSVNLRYNHKYAVEREAYREHLKDSQGALPNV
jgi:hypothetical protein